MNDKPIDIARVPVQEILPFRDLYRKEMNCQIVHDSLHERGFTHSYLIRIGNRVAGYGSVLGFGTEPKDVLKEYYVLSAHRDAAADLFQRTIRCSGARSIEAQTNDTLLIRMLQRYAPIVERQKILFHDVLTTNVTMPGVTFRATIDADRRRVAPRPAEEIGEWLLESAGQIVAHGGVLLHYNAPYGDIYMHVEEPFRRRGYGTYLVQELKRTCYEMGRVPAARCNISNAYSRATLEKAGLLPCAYIVRGALDI